MNLWKESTKLLFVLEVIGTIAFAISGALVAVEKKMDLFGVAMLGMTTAVGGGIFRDLLLGGYTSKCIAKSNLRYYFYSGITCDFYIVYPFIAL